jgi:hypothetical protein
MVIEYTNRNNSWTQQTWLDEFIDDLEINNSDRVSAVLKFLLKKELERGICLAEFNSLLRAFTEYRGKDSTTMKVVYNDGEFK